MEDDETFDAGRGSFLNRDGRVQLDAFIMDGATLRGGGVGHFALRAFTVDGRVGHGQIEIRRRLALRRDHAVRRGWGAVLHVARRLD